MKIFKNKEISWLSFNNRVLQEAVNPSVPLMERLKFLGIFSSNLDEFFRVRVASLNRLMSLGPKAKEIIGDDPKAILREIHQKVIKHQKIFDNTFKRLLIELKKNGIFIINEKELNQKHLPIVQDYFHKSVRPFLTPIMLNKIKPYRDLNGNAIYLVVFLKKLEKGPLDYALIELPTTYVSRFLLLPKEDNKQYIILLDDVIRFSLREIFSILNYVEYEAYTIKVTRDEELDLDADMSESLFRKISKSLSKRREGKPVRFIYDQSIPTQGLKEIKKLIGVESSKINLVSGGRYHNFRDFMNFPKIGKRSWFYRDWPVVSHPRIDRTKSIFKVIAAKDILFHYPYQSFDHVIDFLREASIDPKVVSIRLTSYRLAKDSSIVNALINAARNGKNVTVVLELQARFDEEANIEWTRILIDEGVKVINGVPGLKVHGKLILITLREGDKKYYLGHVGTGNFNELTSRWYTDHSLFTRDKRITKEIRSVFRFLKDNYKVGHYKYLIVSPFTTRGAILDLIDKEIAEAEAGRYAEIFFKMNNFTDKIIIERLYKASKSGVKIKLIVRSMFSLIAGQKGLSENIEARSIVGKLLEHTRIYYFYNHGEKKTYIASCDLMERNLDDRVEVACPIFDESIKQELIEYLETQWNDNVKARSLNHHKINEYVSFYKGHQVAKNKFDSQFKINQLLQKKSRLLKQ